MNRRGRVQKGKRGKPPHPVAYSAVFNQIEELLSSRGACQNSRFEFVTKWFAYSQYEQKRAQAPAVTPPSAATSSSAVMFDGRICCHHNCLGRVLTGTDAVKEFFRRRDKATTQAQRQELVDTFLVTFPVVCIAATQIVLNVGQKLVQSRRRRIKQGNLPGPSVHGLKVYRERNPMYRIDPSLHNKVNVFFWIPI